MKKIDEVIEKINKELENRNTIIRVHRCNVDGLIELTIKDDLFIDKSSCFNMKDDFYTFLMMFIKSIGIKTELSFNNSGRVFWCIDKKGQHWN